MMKRAFFVMFVAMSFGLVSYWNFLGNVFFGGGNTNNIKSSQVASVANALPQAPPVPDYVVVTFAGDVMMDRGVEASVKRNFNGDYNKLFKNVEIFKTDDISFVNLEGPVSDVGRNVGSKYSFRMDPVVLDSLKNAGVDIVSFANNHVGDYTVKAFVDTLNRLKSAGILFAGAGINYDEATEPTMIDKNNIKVCFLAYSDVGPNWIKATDKSAGLLIASDPNFKDTIIYAKSKCDFLAVSIHWGTEYKAHNSRQEKLAHLAINNGADAIIGHHPHVPQDVQMYKGKLIMYSLGNFIFDQSWSAPTMKGLVVQMKVYKDGTARDIKQYQSQQNKFFQIESIKEKVN